MIIINLFGGLGNQLFQLAAAYKLSKIKNKKIFIDYSLENHFRFSHEKIYLTDIFDLHFETKKHNSYCKVLIKKLILKFKFLSYFQDFYVTETNYLRAVNRDLRKIEMLGYWQNLVFFNSHIEEIKKLFKFKHIKINANLLNKISKNNSVSLHVRRGDYTSKKNTTNSVLPIDYYLKAIEKICEKKKNLVFFIFTDDEKWVKDNFLKHFKKIDVNLVSTDKSYKDFFLMTKCKHHIIGNSTFSWWGAFLNNYENKLILYPSIWFKNNQNSPKIFDIEWIKI
jgi:hypothetical protein